MLTIIFLTATFRVDLHPQLQEEYQAAEKRMNELISAGRERFIRNCATVQKQCLMGLDEAKELWEVCIWRTFVCFVLILTRLAIVLQEEKNKLEDVLLASMELKVRSLERELKREARKRKRTASKEGTRAGPAGPTVSGTSGTGAQPESDDSDTDYSDLDEPSGLDPDLVNPDDIGIKGSLSYLDEAGTTFSERLLERLNYFEARVRPIRDKFIDRDRMASQEKEERLLRNRVVNPKESGTTQGGVKRGRNGEPIANIASRTGHDQIRKTARQRSMAEKPAWTPRPLATGLATIRMLQEDERQRALKRKKLGKQTKALPRPTVNGGAGSVPRSSTPVLPHQPTPALPMQSTTPAQTYGSPAVPMQSTTPPQTYAPLPMVKQEMPMATVPSPQPFAPSLSPVAPPQQIPLMQQQQPLFPLVQAPAAAPDVATSAPAPSNANPLKLRLVVGQK